jgi:signal transduction histidine kinase/GAF domain-containing protein
VGKAQASEARSTAGAGDEGVVDADREALRSAEEEAGAGARAAEAGRAAAVASGDTLHAAEPAPLNDLQLLTRLAATAAKGAELDRVVKLVLDDAVEQLGAEVAIVYAASTERRELSLLAHRGLSAAEAERRRRIGFDAPLLASRAAATGEAQFVEGRAAVAELPVEARDDAFHDAGAIASVPLFALGRLTGVLTYARRAPLRLDDAERARVAATTDLFGVALAGGLAARAQQRLQAQLESLLRADAAFGEALVAPTFDLRHVLGVIAEQARVVAGAAYAAIGLDGGADRPFEPWVFAGVSPEMASAIGHDPWPVRLLGLVSREGRTVRLRDLHEHPAFGGVPAHQPPRTGFLGVPIRFQGKPVGNIYLANKLDGDEFTDEDEGAVELLAARAGVALRQGELRASAEVDRAELGAIIASAPHGVLFLDVRTGRVVQNPRSAELLGRFFDVDTSPAAALDALRRLDGSALPDAEHPFARALRGEVVEGTEARLVRPDGTSLPVLVSSVPVLTGGRLAGAVVVWCVDIRRQVEVREALVAERERLAKIVASVPQGVVLLDASATVVAANPRALELAGAPLVGLDLRQGAALFQRPDGAPLAEGERPVARALAGETVAHAALALARADRTRLPVAVSASPVAGADGAEAGAVVVFEDASREKASQRRQEDWVARVAHDLRQPLSVISTYIEVLQRLRDVASSPEEKDRILGRTRSAARTLQHMIDDLLDVARIESGELGLDRQDADLAALAREVAERTAVVEGRPIEVRAEAARACIDARRVDQLLSNLLSNAVKYGAAGAPIVVAVERGDGEARLSVTNVGPAVPEAERAQLFSRFFRAKGSSRAVVGTGLGLYICKAIAEAHGGGIEAEFGPDDRTTFRVRLPAGARGPSASPG